MGAVAAIGFRINPDVAAGTHAKITTGTADNKFGIAAAQAINAYGEAATLPGLKITGLTVHIGSQLMSLAPLETAFTRLGEILGQLRSAGHDIRWSISAGASACRTDRGSPTPRRRKNMARWCGGSAKAGRRG